MTLRSLMLGITITMVGLATGAHAAESPEKPMGERAKEAAESAADTVSDSWITLKTKLALYADERVSGTAINVDTRQGVVTLRGEVPSRAAKEAAGADARQIEGVKRVENALAVRPLATQKSMAERKDEQITQDVEARLEKEPSLKDASVDVETDQGIVTLTGKAPSLRASVRASELAHRVAGVRAVENELDVPDRDKRG